MSASIGVEAGHARCTTDTYCKALDDRIEGMANHRGKGLVLMVMTNFTTGDTRKVGVAYKLSAKDGGLLLNHCPFCGERIDQGFRNPATGESE